MYRVPSFCSESLFHMWNARIWKSCHLRWGSTSIQKDGDSLALSFGWLVVIWCNLSSSPGFGACQPYKWKQIKQQTITAIAGARVCQAHSVQVERTRTGWNRDCVGQQVQLRAHIFLQSVNVIRNMDYLTRCIKTEAAGTRQNSAQIHNLGFCFAIIVCLLYYCVHHLSPI